MSYYKYIVKIPFFLVSIALSGCGAHLLIQGEPNFNTNLLLPQLGEKSAGNFDPETDPASGKIDTRANYSLYLTPSHLPDSCGEKKSDPPTDINKCVLSIIAYINESYREYKITLHHFVSYGNAGADTLQEGLSIASSVAPSQAASKIYSAIASGVGSTKTQVDEDLVFQKTIEIVLNQMDADRKTQEAYIVTQLKNPSYTMEQADIDLLEFFSDGTWDHAMTALQTQVGVNNANAQTTLCNAKQGSADSASPGGANPPSNSSTTSSPAKGGQTPNSTTGCPSAPSIPTTVGVTVKLPATIAAKDGTQIKFSVSNLTDDSATISFLVAGKPLVIASADSKPPAPTQTALDIQPGTHSVILQSLPNAGSEIDVQVAGKKGTMTTGPQAIGKINVK